MTNYYELKCLRGFENNVFLMKRERYASHSNYLNTSIIFKRIAEKRILNATCYC